MAAEELLSLFFPPPPPSLPLIVGAVAGVPVPSRHAPVAQGEISPCVCITTHVWEKPNTCFFGFSTHVWLFPHVCAKTHTSVVKTTLMVTVLCVDFTTHMW